MLKTLGKWLKVYEDELQIFLWAVLLLFLIRSASLLFNNFAETAFLKRFGVEYLPIVYVANSISTFLIMGFLTGLMSRMPGTRLLAYLLLFCGSTVAGLRFVIPLGFELLYPILFVLKGQYEVLLALIFWNLANDLFNTRQSKRLFPLITAGGVVGGILGSFGTPLLRRTIGMDNLMLAYLVFTVLAALTVTRMGSRFPTRLLGAKGGKKKGARTSMIGEFKRAFPLIKESKLVRILIMLTLMPNVVIPILNYQFNFTIDQNFATEGKMISFFAYFNGSLNIVSLTILMFVGRIYGKWGLPVALMFHPFNYMLAFLAFLLRFDIFAAMYARVSTTVLRTTLNNPARNVLMGLFPESYRGAIRPFLRGTIVRIGVLTGAGLIILSEQFVHPRYLSTVGMVFVGGWIVSVISLKRSYGKILLDLISRNMLDVKSMEQNDLGPVFSDKNAQGELLTSFQAARGTDCLWLGGLLKTLAVPDPDAHILQALQEQDDDTRIGLLALLSPDAGERALPVFEQLAAGELPDLRIALLKASRGFSGDAADGFRERQSSPEQNVLVRAHAIAGLYGRDPAGYGAVIDGWLQSGDVTERRAGVIAAGGSGDPVYAEKLQEMLVFDAPVELLPDLLAGLQILGQGDLNPLVKPYFQHADRAVRRSALGAYQIRGDEETRAVIALLGDPSPGVHRLARQNLEEAPELNSQVLIEALVTPHRRVRERIYDLLAAMNITDPEIFRFAQSQLEHCYGHVAEIGRLQELPPSPERDLLVDHLHERKRGPVENVLRVLVAQDRTGQMKFISRGVFSPDGRQRSNSVEALEDTIGSSLAGLIVPLVEDLPVEQILIAGRKRFKLPDPGTNPEQVMAHLLTAENAVTVMLALYWISRHGREGLAREQVAAHTAAEHPEVRRLARAVLGSRQGAPAPEENQMTTEMSVPDKILFLRKIQIFEGLAVGELAAVASVTEEEDFPADTEVIREGDPGDIMYLIIKGSVAVLKRLREEGDSRLVELDRIGVGDYFGEMALFEGNVRTATIRAVEDCRFLSLHKREFTEIVREYPQIALHICKVLSDRLVKLHEKVMTLQQDQPG